MKQKKGGELKISVLLCILAIVTACTGGKECVNGTCQCLDDKPLWIGSTCVAKATCTENQWYNATTNQCDAKAECGEYELYIPYFNLCLLDCYVNVDNGNCICPENKCAVMGSELYCLNASSYPSTNGVCNCVFDEDVKDCISCT